MSCSWTWLDTWLKDGNKDGMRIIRERELLPSDRLNRFGVKGSLKYISHQLGHLEESGYQNPNIKGSLRSIKGHLESP